MDEAFGFYVGLRRVGFGSDVFDAHAPACAGEGVRAVATAVVGHDTINGDTETAIIGDGGGQESDRAGLLSSGKISMRATREWSSMAT